MNMSAVAASPEACNCPTCGAMLHDDRYKWDSDNRTFVGGGVAVRFSRSQAKMMNALWRTRSSGGIEGILQFMQLAYGNDADGGPLTTSVISVHLHHIRKKLRGTGYTVSMNMGSPRIGYRIVKIEGHK